MGVKCRQYHSNDKQNNIMSKKEENMKNQNLSDDAMLEHGDKPVMCVCVCVSPCERMCVCTD